MTPILIGITGRFGTGKSTLAVMISEMIPDAQVVAFADALKRDVLGMVNRTLDTAFTLDDLERDKATIWGNILQGYGELCRRHHGPDYWVDRLAAVLPPRAIVADVRYASESAWLHRHDGLLVTVEGPERRVGDLRSATHPSELGLPVEHSQRGLLVTNTGTLADLRRQARDIARIAEGLSRLEVAG